MTTLSYSLHINTPRSAREVLQICFQTEDIASIAGTDIQYTRGRVFLAHVRTTNLKTTEQFHAKFSVSPTVSILYFPDGVSSFQTALDELLDAALIWLRVQSDDAVLVANNTQLVLKRVGSKITLAQGQPFWTPERLKRVDLPYLPS